MTQEKVEDLWQSKDGKQFRKEIINEYNFGLISAIHFIRSETGLGLVSAKLILDLTLKLQCNSMTKV